MDDRYAGTSERAAVNVASGGAGNDPGASPLARSYTLPRRRAIGLLYRKARGVHPASRWRGIRVAIRHGLLSSKKRRTVQL